jgi:phosphopantothenoylcysteine synthetase/decarboxylase
MEATLRRLKENERQEKLFESLSAGVEEFNVKLREQIELFGLTSNEQTLEKLRKAGEELRGFDKITFNNLIMDSKLLLEVLTRMEDQAKKTNKAVELTAAQKAEMTRLERIKDFADAVKQDLKSNLTLLKEWRDKLNEAVATKDLLASQAAESLRRKALDLFPMDGVAGGGGAAAGRGRSEAIRTSLVSVAGLTGSANPQVRQQERTNTLLEDQNRTLQRIEQKEGLG